MHVTLPSDLLGAAFIKRQPAPKTGIGPKNFPRTGSILVGVKTMPETQLDGLMASVYRQLHKMAKRYMEQQKPGHTLQTTALIHEAYLKLAAHAEVQLESRDHFLLLASRAM